jgi:peptide/nickel transport system permease protein
MLVAAETNGWLPFWQYWGITIQNGMVLLLLFATALLVWKAGTLPDWVSAARQLRAQRLPMIALVIFVAYALIGVMDSISWRDVTRDNKGAELRGPDGQPVLQSQPKTLLDRTFALFVGKPLRDFEEKTYSAPLDSKQFVRDNIIKSDGTVQRDFPELSQPRQHILGTDRTGRDTLYAALKGIRTALILGLFTTLIAVPFAILFGVLAGFYGGWVDDAIQYLYTTLSCIPGVLLIIAFMMIVGERSLAMLCIAMGITSWTGLCRLLRAETLKTRELDYVQAAEAMGVSRMSMLFRHIVPNLMHIILITTVLRFSGLVMSEVALAYIGVGVDASAGSWGNMITTAKEELGRDPVIWWNLTSAFGFMFVLVLAVNLLGDALRDALDPKLRTR